MTNSAKAALAAKPRERDVAVSKSALITGITGQDGSYLAELLLAKGYEVHGIIRRSSTFNTERIDDIYQDPHDERPPAVPALRRPGRRRRRWSTCCATSGPTRSTTWAPRATSRSSFETPEYTGDVTGLGTMRLLEAIRASEVDTRFYQASSSEMFGSTPPPQNEATPFHPRSPYGVREGLRLLGDGQLPRGLRHARLQRHPLQPRVARAAARPS